MKHTALRVAGLPAALLILILGAGCATSGDVGDAEFSRRFWYEERQPC